jgi:hypothetical protein
MPSIEQITKQQFAKVFAVTDWRLFKVAAEYYLKTAAFIKKRDINVQAKHQLLIRNSQKRLFIGIGIELLLKAAYLKHGYLINRGGGLPIPFTVQQAKDIPLDADQTFGLNDLIEHLGKVLSIPRGSNVRDGLKIAKVFRNKEGHSVTAIHAYQSDEYRKIEQALIELYSLSFNQTLVVHFSVEKGERPKWSLS